MASRAVGFGANPNLETSITSLKANGRTLEALAKIKPWTLLKLNGTHDADAALLSRLRDTMDMDFNLETTKNGSAWIRPAKVHEPHIVQGCVADADYGNTLNTNATTNTYASEVDIATADAQQCTSAWSVPRAFPTANTVGVRIRVLSAVQDQPGTGKDLLQLQSKTVVRTANCSGAISTVPVPHASASASASDSASVAGGRWGGPASSVGMHASAVLALSSWLSEIEDATGFQACFSVVDFWILLA
jgi:hypothetical protein